MVYIYISFHVRNCSRHSWDLVLKQTNEIIYSTANVESLVYHCCKQLIESLFFCVDVNKSVIRKFIHYMEIPRYPFLSISYGLEKDIPNPCMWLCKSLPNILDVYLVHIPCLYPLNIQIAPTPSSCGAPTMMSVIVKHCLI